MIEVDAAQALPIIFRTDSPNARAAEVWTFFPDPWRKKRHVKRRIVNLDFARTVAGVLASDGVWRLATDWDDYAWQMRDVVTDSPYVVNLHGSERPDPNDDGKYEGGFAPRFEGRVMTRFEQRGIDAGRTIHDIEATPSGLETELPWPAWESQWAQEIERAKERNANPRDRSGQSA